MSAAEEKVDVIVSGAGASGLAAAIALARAGYSVLCAGVSDTRPTGRTVALFEGSIRTLRALGVWERFAEIGQPIRAIRIIDDTGSRFPVPPLTLRAEEIALDALGTNVENDRLIAGLIAEAQALPGIQLTEAKLDSIAFTCDAVRVRGADGQTISAPLIVAADGRRSPARTAAGIAARSWSYPQTALIALTTHSRPHDGFSTEFHTRGGPCTLVPLRATEASPHRSSLVWLMSTAEFERRSSLDDVALAAELTVQTRGRVGDIRLETARGAFPMGGLHVNRLAAARIALVGEAAHAFPPLAAQGLNLSLRDIAQLVATLGTKTQTRDIGAATLLASYERARRRDVALRTHGVDVLSRSLLTDFAPVDVARGIGATALRMVGPLRRAVLREGILPPGPVLPLPARA